MTTTPLKFLSIESTFNSNNNNKKPIIKRIYKLFNKKYSKMPKSYNMNIIDNIIYNEKSHIVAVFKDRLIIDDTGEFLKRYYKIRESNIRLPKFYEYYELYSKIFPNYTAFYEGKYLYQNIQRKQRMIDLQERLEMEEFNDEDKSKSSRYENKEKVFNTDAIDSILNGTNNEGMEIIFNVNKNNIKQDEENFKKEINDIIDVINNYEIKNKLNINKKYSNHEIKNNNNINKNASIPLNLNYSKTKRLRNSNSIILNNNNTNNTYYNNIQSIISKFFKIPSHKKNGILNLHNNLNKDSKIDGKSKLYPKKDKKLFEKLEHNLFKIKQKPNYFQKNLSQNISTSNQTQKDISISKRNTSIYIKKPSSSTSSHHNHNNKNKSLVNSSSTYKIPNESVIKVMVSNKNIEISGKNTSLTSRNPSTSKSGTNLCNTKSIKSIKNNIRSIVEYSSRNKHSNHINMNNKPKFTIKGHPFSSCSKIRENKDSKSKSKKILNTKFNDKNTNVMGYKEINYIKCLKNFKNNHSKEKKMSNEKNENISRNKGRIKQKNISQPKTNFNKRIKNMSRNDSSLKIGVSDALKIKHKNLKGINISSFSKITNFSNINIKNISKTYRNSFGLHKK